MIQDAIGRGMRKVNIDTDGRLAVTAAIREYFATHPEHFDPRQYLGPARDALTKWVVEEMKAFGSAGHAGDYPPMTLKDMKVFYMGAGSATPSGSPDAAKASGE
jgi:fructose-bisphosphate aldolase class II